MTKNGRPKRISKLAHLQPDKHNANAHTERGSSAMESSIRECGYGDSMTVDRDGVVISGGQRLETLADLQMDNPLVVQSDGTRPIVHQRTDLSTDDPRRKRLALWQNRVGELNLSWSPEELKALDVDLSGLWSEAELTELLGQQQEEVGDGPEPQIDKADELQQKWGTKLGQVWEIGKHRLMCGDSTEVESVDRLLAGSLAVLCQADPPYGMGKENEGVANDNLYGPKLDAFQMKWWEAARRHLADSASVYIWGTAEDLWRLWYGGIKVSERLTLRNEIVWNKGSGQGMEADSHRMYPTCSERCLFFMRGEQGFNVNADNYWEGWEPIRKYLKEERDKLGWDNEKCKRIAGHSPTSGCHWFDESQWMMPTKETYEAWKRAAKDEAFKRDYEELKRDYEELKRDWYATRSYFDNTHDKMTDVWSFPRVQGDERHGHPTPKPVPMIRRIIESSSPEGGLVYDPFVGSGVSFVASEQLKRVCVGMEINPAYVAVTIQRMVDLGLEPKLLSSS